MTATRILASLPVVFFLVGACSAASKADVALLIAAEHGNVAAARTALRGGANANAQHEEGNTLTALMLAARGGHAALVRVLLGAGADPNRTASVAVGSSGVNDGLTALMQAAASGDLPTVRALVDKGANVNAAATFSRNGQIGKGGFPVTFHAANSVVLEALLKSGADRNARDAYENTLLMYAAEHLDASAICLLLRDGVDRSVRNTAGQTALDLAKKASNDAIVKALEGGSAAGCLASEKRRAA